MSVRIPYRDVRVSRMVGSDMLIYLLSPIFTPSHLLTRGSAIPSVSIDLAEHHLISTARHHSWSSAAELLFALLRRAVLHTQALPWQRPRRTGLGGISAKPSPKHPVVSFPAGQTVTSADRAFPGGGHSACLASAILGPSIPVGPSTALPSRFFTVWGGTHSAQVLLGPSSGSPSLGE